MTDLSAVNPGMAERLVRSEVLRELAKDRAVQVIVRLYLHRLLDESGVRLAFVDAVFTQLPGRLFEILQETPIDELAEYVRAEIRRFCPGCSGRVENLDDLGVGECSRCGGVVATRPLPSPQAVDRYVNFKEWGDGGLRDAIYFSMLWSENRTGSDGIERERDVISAHGWMNSDRRMVQSG